MAPEMVRLGWVAYSAGGQYTPRGGGRAGDGGDHVGVMALALSVVARSVPGWGSASGMGNPAVVAVATVGGDRGVVGGAGGRFGAAFRRFARLASVPVVIPVANRLTTVGITAAAAAGLLVACQRPVLTGHQQN